MKAIVAVNGFRAAQEALKTTKSFEAGYALTVLAEKLAPAHSAYTKAFNALVNEYGHEIEGRRGKVVDATLPPETLDAFDAARSALDDKEISIEYQQLEITVLKKEQIAGTAVAGLMPFIKKEAANADAD